MPGLQKHHMENALKVTLGLLGGFALFRTIAHPKSPVNKKIPHKRVKNFTFMPHMKYHHKDTVYHFHHWLNLGALYLVLLKYRRFRSKLLHGFLLGSILEGLTYTDSLRLKYKTQPSVTGQKN